MFFLRHLFAAAIGAVASAFATHAAGEKDRKSAKYHKDVANDLSGKYLELEKRYSEYSEQSKQQIKDLTQQHALDEVDKDSLRLAIRLQQCLYELMWKIDNNPTHESLREFEKAVFLTNTILFELKEEFIQVPKEYFSNNLERANYKISEIQGNVFGNNIYPILICLNCGQKNRIIPHNLGLNPICGICQSNLQTHNGDEIGDECLNYKGGEYINAISSNEFSQFKYYSDARYDKCNAIDEKNLEILKSFPILQIFDFEVVTVNLSEGGLLNLNHSYKQAKFYYESLQNAHLEMIHIPNGKFLMGLPVGSKERSPYEYPQHSVNVQAFFIGKYPITQKQWSAVASLPKIEYDLDSECSYFKGETLPVEQVTWSKAVEFCKRLSCETGRLYRLPSEAEWEYACRAETTTSFHFGEMINPELANYYYGTTDSDGSKERYGTTNVCQFPPNRYGIHDMHGNVLEWCEDSWHANYEGAPSDGITWCNNNGYTSRVMRGGSWLHPLWKCRSSYRYLNSPNDCSCSVGFRVVCEIPKTS